MDRIGLAERIVEATINIDFGRKAFAIRGKEQEGRISYETGIDEASAAFVEARTHGDPETILLAEYSFITQELQFCDKSDRYARGSLSRAIQSFDDAMRVLPVVEDGSLYSAVDKAFPRQPAYRVNGFPKDSFHIACRAHKTRIQNLLRTPGMDGIEKALLKERFANLSAGQNKYVKKQEKALTA